MRLFVPPRFALSVTALTLLLIGASSLLADTDVLKNGDRLTGTALKLDGGKLTFKTAYADPIAIAWDQVASLTTDKALVLPTAKGKLNVTQVERADANVMVKTDSGTVTLAAGEVAALRTPADEQAYEASLNPSWAHAWAGAANVSLAVAKGNANTVSFGAGLTAVRATRTDKTSLYANTLNSENSQASPTTNNTTGGGFRYDHNVTPRAFVFGTGDFLADTLQNLDLRSIVGGGFGWHVRKTPKQTFDVLGGLVWTHEDYAAFTSTVVTGTTTSGDTTTTTTTTTTTPATVNSFAALDLGEVYTRKFGANNLFTEQAYIYPDMSTLGQYQLTVNSSFSTKIGKMFNWVTSVSDSYTSFPPPGTVGDDLILTTGLGISLTRK
jgi:putative salt-induced outer membrane protein YdiY